MTRPTCGPCGEGGLRRGEESVVGRSRVSCYPHRLTGRYLHTLTRSSHRPRAPVPADGIVGLRGGTGRRSAARGRRQAMGGAALGVAGLCGGGGLGTSRGNPLGCPIIRLATTSAPVASGGPVSGVVRHDRIGLWHSPRHPGSGSHGQRRWLGLSFALRSDGGGRRGRVDRFGWADHSLPEARTEKRKCFAASQT